MRTIAEGKEAVLSYLEEESQKISGKPGIHMLLKDDAGNPVAFIAGRNLFDEGKRMMVVDGLVVQVQDTQNQTRRPSYNFIMSQLTGYDGAVNGVNILHGVAVLPEDSAPHAVTLQPLSIDAVIQRAADVIGDRAEAMRWLGTPVRALDYATPIALLHDVRGADRVLAVLTRLEHGVL